MPVDLTVFAAKYLVFVAAVLGAVVLAVRLWQRSRLQLVHWLFCAGLLLGLSYALALLGASLFNDPRPFTTSHVPH